MATDADLSYTFDGGIAHVVLAGARSSALSTRVIRALEEAADRIKGDQPRCVVLSGTGRTFCAGADLDELAGFTASEFSEWNIWLASVMESWARLPMPVVAAVTGHALGGGLELALTADHRILTKGATVGLPEVRLGIIPGAGGTHRLADLVGRHRASWLIMRGARLTSEEALAMGLVDEVSEDPLERARELAHEVAELPACAVRAAKRVLAEEPDPSHMRRVQTAIAALFESPERQERFRAFLGRRSTSGV